ncbi:MAG: hypothetical protein ACI9WO_002246, partial [Sphingobacteriales bacterium]
FLSDNSSGLQLISKLKIALPLNLGCVGRLAFG